MAQLIMRWKSDGTPAKPVQPSAGVAVRTLPELENGRAVWLDIVQHMWRNSVTLQEDYFEKAMLSQPCFREDLCHILTVDGIPAATITVICNPETKAGLIHMVACKPEFRGRGLGHLLNDVASAVLKRESMETARLTTDDWRIPAIKTYLKAGFHPDLETEADFKDRWDKIYQEIGA